MDSRQLAATSGLIIELLSVALTQVENPPLASIFSLGNARKQPGKRVFATGICSARTAVRGAVCATSFYRPLAPARRAPASCLFRPFESSCRWPDGGFPAGRDAYESVPVNITDPSTFREPLPPPPFIIHLHQPPPLWPSSPSLIPPINTFLDMDGLKFSEELKATSYDV